MLISAYEHSLTLLELGLTVDEVGKENWEIFRKLVDCKRAIPSPMDNWEETLIGYGDNLMLRAYKM